MGLEAIQETISREQNGSYDNIGKFDLSLLSSTVSEQPLNVSEIRQKIRE